MHKLNMLMALPEFAIYNTFTYSVQYLPKQALIFAEGLAGLLNGCAIFLLLSRFQANLPELLFHGLGLGITQTTQSKSIGAGGLVGAVGNHSQIEIGFRRLRCQTLGLQYSGFSLSKLLLAIRLLGLLHQLFKGRQIAAIIKFLCLWFLLRKDNFLTFNFWAVI